MPGRRSEPEVSRDPGICRWPLCSDPITTRYRRELYLCDWHIRTVWTTVDAKIRAEVTRERLAENVGQRDLTAGTVYYLRIGDHVKVGWASDLAARLKAYPPTAELLATHPGTPATEREVHSLLTAHLIAGREWYSADPEVLAHIGRVIAEMGRPPDPFAQRRKVDKPSPLRPGTKSRRRATGAI